MTRMRRPGQNDLSGAFRFTRKRAADAGNTARPPNGNTARPPKADSVPPDQRRDTGRSVAPKPTIRLPPPISSTAGTRRFAAQQRPPKAAHATNYLVTSRTTITIKSRTRCRAPHRFTPQRHRRYLPHNSNRRKPHAPQGAPHPPPKPAPTVHNARTVCPTSCDDGPVPAADDRPQKSSRPYKKGCPHVGGQPSSHKRSDRYSPCASL